MEKAFQIQELVSMFLERVPYIDHENVARVCPQWRNIVSDTSGFLQRRRESEWDEALLVVFKAVEVEDEEDDEDSGSDSDDDVEEGFQSSVRLVDPGTGRWYPIAPLPQPRLDHCSAFINGALYVIGGCDATYKPLGAVHRYNVVSNTWTPCASLMEPRTGARCGVVGGGIVVAGGWSGGSHLSSVEFYDPTTNSWVIREPMKCARGWANVCVLPSNRICMSGGIADDAGDSNDSAEVYDFFKNTWTLLPRAESSGTGGRSMLPIAHPNSGLMLLGTADEDEDRSGISRVTALVLDDSPRTTVSSSLSDSDVKTEDMTQNKPPYWRRLKENVLGSSESCDLPISSCLAIDEYRSILIVNVTGEDSKSDCVFDVRSNEITVAPWSLPLAGSDTSCAAVRI